MKHTEETKAKLSLMRRGERNPFFGKRHTPEFIEAQRERTRAYSASRQYDASPQSILIPGDVATLAYLAGMIDADGSIRFKRGYPFVSIYNTHEPLIRWLTDTLRHGCVGKGNMGRSQVMSWTIQAARDVYALLTAIRPFLIVKAGDADAALSYLRGKYTWAK